MTGRLLQNCRLLSAGLALACVLIASRPVAAQTTATSSDDAWDFRYELFQMLLEQNGVRPVANMSAVTRRPPESIIVMLGHINFRTSRFLESFCEQGGAVLLATDERYSAGRICEFREGPVTSLQSAERYQNYADCLTITDIDHDHPLMTGVNSLVVNRTGWLAPPRWYIPDMQVAARLPQRTLPRDSSDQPLLATVGLPNINTGQLIVASDPSLFTNGMLWHGDNAILAINVSRILCSRNKNKMLFIADGVPLGSFRNSPMVDSNNPPPLPENLPEPALETYVKVVNTVLKEVEDQNLPNQFMADRRHKIRSPYLRRHILLSLAIAVLMFVIWKMAATHSATHPAMPIRDMKSAHDLATGHKVKSAEFGLSASILARELCRHLTESSDPTDWRRQLIGNAASGEGEVEFHGVSNVKAQRKKLVDVIELATNTRTVHMSRKRFEALGQTIDQLRQLHAEGRLIVAASAEVTTQVAGRMA